MKRKTLLIVLILIAILFINNVSFATNEVKNDVHSVTDTVVDGAGRLGNDVKNGIGTAEGAIENGARDLGNTFSDGINDIGDTVTNGMQSVTGTMNSNYNATRTTASDLANTNTMNFSVWTWVTVGIAGIVIVGLVWYYAQEHEER